jgi:hypothetical protein
MVNPPNDILSKVSGDALGAIIPEQYLRVAVDHVHSDVEVFQDQPEKIKATRLRHPEVPFNRPIGGLRAQV